jgi:hypothetical protein
MDKYKRIVDNRLDCYGEIDDKKKVIRINKKKNKKMGDRGELINTILHEECHRLHPKMKEKAIQKLTIKIVDKLSPREKKRYYNMYNK